MVDDKTLAIDKDMARRDFADYVRKRRRVLGFRSAEDLAKAVGVTQQTVDKWERAVSVPHLDTLLDLARALQVDHSVLTTFLRTSPPSPEAVRNNYEALLANDPYMKPEFAEMIRFIISLNDKYSAQQEDDAPAQIAESRGEYRPQVIAAAGTKSDLDLPENQRLLNELASEDEAEAHAAEEAKKKRKRQPPQPKQKPKE